jgi:hypothetical protein
MVALNSRRGVGHDRIHYGPSLRQGLVFILLVFLFSIPIWWFDRALGLPNQVPVDRPISAIAILAPALTALMLTRMAGGRGAAGSLLKRSADVAVISKNHWWLVALLLMPGLFLLQYVLLRTIGSSLPAAQLNLVSAALLLAVLLPAAWLEEFGWQGYLYPRFRLLGPVVSGTLIGVAWAAWHLVPILGAGRSLTWIAWHALGAILLRLIIVLSVSRAGESVMLATLFHATFNWGLYLFPVDGSHYDPALTCAMLAPVVVAFLLLDRLQVPNRVNGRRSVDRS